VYYQAEIMKLSIGNSSLRRRSIVSIESELIRPIGSKNLIDFSLSKLGGAVGHVWHLLDAVRYRQRMSVA
jgi:hypothetical protein